jgi:hypothetical protein
MVRPRVGRGLRREWASQGSSIMAFAEDFAQALRDSGIKLDSSELPSQDDIQTGLDRLQSWLDSLEPDTKLAADEVTADLPVKAGLADPEVGIAPGLSIILRAADQAPVTLSISELLETCRNAVQQASSGQG